MSKDYNYNQIYHLWKNERQTTQLLEVKSNLYSAIRQKITSYEKELKKIDNDDKTSQKIIDVRIERLKQILRDLTKIRLHKIVHGLLAEDWKPEDLAAEELDLVKNLNRIFDEHNKRSILGEAIPDLTKEDSMPEINYNKLLDSDLMTVRILEDIPEILAASAKGDSKKSFGPFKKEDIVRLPLIYAKTLIMKNAADRVDLPDL